jgi:hypothetical protein
MVKYSLPKYSYNTEAENNSMHVGLIYADFPNM